MPNIRFFFDYEDVPFDRGDIIDWLRDCTCFSEVNLDSMSDEELVALLSENNIEEFYDSMVSNGATCIRCEIAHD